MAKPRNKENDSEIAVNMSPHTALTTAWYLHNNKKGRNGSISVFSFVDDDYEQERKALSPRWMRIKMTRTQQKSLVAHQQ